MWTEFRGYCTVPGGLATARDITIPKPESQEELNNYQNLERFSYRERGS